MVDSTPADPAVEVDMDPYAARVEADLAAVADDRRRLAALLDTAAGALATAEAQQRRTPTRQVDFPGAPDDVALFLADARRMLRAARALMPEPEDITW
ncbi:hypothetical protein [Pseudofrankia asymbiotica]|uniref:Uncharacterized protein n=1 Tax=Pseudofrankia asymbiotica TaxID=1834516 RepID=A0A1V2I2N7_9ACTN|nr:hypothetical protein [Pseudofrankia asymbiotica]ONH23836.1 hypothetical protein BL253_31970 [Pseudofrankia asymbiotica]